MRADGSWCCCRIVLGGDISRNAEFIDSIYALSLTQLLDLSSKSHMSVQDCVDGGETIPVSVRALGRDECELVCDGVVVE